MTYALLKTIHVGTVAASGLMFVVRGIWMMRQSPLLQQRWVRILPHINDSILLASAIGLVLVLHQYPFVENWLTAKVCALFVYIVLGSIALRYGRSQRIRVIAWISALSTYIYIVSVALTHNPCPACAM